MNKYRLSFKSASDLLKYTKDQGVQFIHYNFTDLRGKWYHSAQHVSACTSDIIDTGIALDSSLIAGWSEDADTTALLIRPDISRVSYDPFAAQKTIKILCDVYDPVSKLPYKLDPRNVAKKAQDFLKKSGIGDVVYFGPEIEFFIFENVKIVNKANQVGYHLDSEEGSYNKSRDYPTGNMGHRPDVGKGYLSESPTDGLSDIRAEMLSVIESMGVMVEKHYHSLAPSQCALGIRFSGLLDSADNVQIYKHVVHNVAHSYGKSATFMPKPINGDYGSAMRINQSIWKNGKPLFSGEEYAGLSETALFYIGGILKHANALNALTNPSTNSYKRLAAKGKAPSLLGYSKQCCLTACRVPYAQSASSKRIEACFPDPTANPYLAFSALLMAGLDGIENKIHPGEAIDKKAGEGKKAIPQICSSLRQALDSLESDHAFLLKGNVFTKEFLEAYAALKKKELERYETTTHPVEVDMYYSS